MTTPCYFSFKPLRCWAVSFGLLALLLPGLSQAQQAGAPTVLRDRRAGGSAEEYLSATIATADGGYLLAGYSFSGATGDKTQPSQGVDDFWVVKYDAAGTRQWDRRFGGDQSDRLFTAIQTADGGYLLGGEATSDGTGDMSQRSQGYGDFWVVKLDAAGAKLWDRRYGGQEEDVLTAAVQTTDGGYLLAGSTRSSGTGDVSQLSQGVGDGWAVKIDATGVKQWDRRFGGTSEDVFTNLLQTTDGGYLLGGWTTSGPSGNVSQPSRGSADYWIVKTDAAGTRLWDRRFGSNYEDVLATMVQTADGGFLLGGTSTSDAGGDKTQPSHGTGNTGRNDYWLVKTDDAGTKVWDRRYGGGNDDFLNSVCPAPNGGYLLAGTSRSGAEDDKTQPSQGLDDYWLVRINGNGTQLWDQRLGGLDDDTDAHVVGFTGGGFLVAGTSNSGVSGNKTQPSQGLHDYWAVRLGAEPLATTAPQGSPAVAVYPNPAHATCMVALPGRGTGAATATLSLLDLVGREVQRQSPVLGTAPSTALLPLHNLAAGMYLLRVELAGETTTRRLEVK